MIQKKLQVENLSIFHTGKIKSSTNFFLSTSSPPPPTSSDRHGLNTLTMEMEVLQNYCYVYTTKGKE